MDIWNKFRLRKEYVERQEYSIWVGTIDDNIVTQKQLALMGFEYSLIFDN